MRQFYSKKIGWTEVGIKEQERRSDLENLTADELLRWLPPAGKTRPAIVTNDLAWAEIRRRLERLEQCEALAKYAQHWPTCNFGWPICDCGFAAARAAVEGK